MRDVIREADPMLLNARHVYVAESRDSVAAMCREPTDEIDIRGSIWASGNTGCLLVETYSIITLTKQTNYYINIGLYNLSTLISHFR